MKIKIRTMRNENIEIEIDPEATVDQLKGLVEEKTQQPKAWQKLIYNGKILADENTVASYTIKEGGFVVLFSKQPKATEKAEPEKKETPAAIPASPQPGAEPVAQPAQPTQPATPSTPTQPPIPQTTQPETLYSSAASAFVTNDAMEPMIMQIMEMGFERDQIVRALNAANRNPDVAVQLLLSGNVPDVPASPQGPVQQQPQHPQQPTQPEGGAEASPFDFLRNHPQFNMLRALVQTNPGSLQGILQQLAQSNPQILQLINEHQEEFLQLLQEPVDPSSLGLGGAGGGAPGAAPGVIQVTQAEKEAIDRLCSLGFDRHAVIEAFFACDKDEQLAANYLLEGGGFDDDDDDFGGDDDQMM